MKKDATETNRAANWRLPLGPGLIVAAAFVGPGTVTVAAKAGAQYGFGLLWVVVFSILSAMVLQEMSARLGTLTGIGLGEILRRQFTTKAKLFPLAALIVIAIGFGNAAYQTGNLTGAALGIVELTRLTPPLAIIFLTFIAGGLLWFGSYRWLERSLVATVALMGFAFSITATLLVYTRPPTLGQLRPVMSIEMLTMILALIGTTIVPYNLFLHSSTTAKRWSPIRPRDKGVRAARLDSMIGVTLGGIVTACILVSSAIAIPGTEIQSAADIAPALEIILGDRFASLLFAVGIAAAGLSSAITAPLAAAYAICGILGWSTEPSSARFRAIWLIVLATGSVVSLTLGSSPTETILVAQAANAFALPLIAGILIMACNAKLLSRYKNTKLNNVFAACVLVVIVLLSISKLVAW